MGGKGFLGTNASVLADVTLILSVIIAIILTIGVVMALLKRYGIHRWLQTSAVILNALLVVLVMVGSFLRSVLPGVQQRLDQPYYYVATLHGLVGIFAFVYGSYVALRANEIMPKALRFSNYKVWMRFAYTLYMLATALGIWVYVVWYTGPAIAAEGQPIAQAPNEQVVPMANFVFTPVELVIPVGTTVVWANQDSAPHNAVADDGIVFRSELLQTGQEFRFTFSEEGLFPYYCELHGSPGVDMAGTIRVVPAGQAPVLAGVPTPVAGGIAQPTPQPLPAQPFGQTSGTAAFRDALARNDQIVVELNPGAAPAGQVLTAFLTSDDGTTTLPLGQLQPGADGITRVVFSEPNGQNLLASYSWLLITQEAGGQSLFESQLPPQAALPIRQLLVDGPGVPNPQGYVVGLRTQTDELLRHTQFMLNSQAGGDLEGIKRHAELVFNLVSGSLDPQFGDLNGDSRPQNPGDGFGLLQNGGQAGYIKLTGDTAVAAAGAPDASDSIKVHGEHVRISAENLRGWSAQARELALQLTRATDAVSVKPQIDQLLTLSQSISRGADVNGDGRIDPVPGEAGTLLAYEHAQYMAGFGIVPVQP
ncbi:MAG: cupredoxin domain-containing protein [Roseiflexaceae bacterium]|nr:cupredoxin domain-containing protein [Roseiflexaceae bacterium]